MNTNSAPLLEDALALDARPTTRRDLDDVMRIEAKCFDEDARETRAVYRQRLRQFPEGCQLAVVDGHPAGFFISELWSVATLDEDLFERWPDDVCSHHADGHRLYVSAVAVVPAYQGRGIASRFLAGCLHRLLPRLPQVDEVFLTVAEDWGPARRLYTRAGFRERLVLPGFFSRTAGARDGLLMSAPVRELLVNASGARHP